MALDFGKIGPRIKEMDKETAIVIFRACGMPIPMTDEEWKKYLEEMEKFFKKLSNEQKENMIGFARKVAFGRTKITEKELKKLGESIPLQSKKINGLDLIERFESFSQEQKDFIIEMIMKGITAQDKPLQVLQLQFEKDTEGNKSKTVVDMEDKEFESDL